MNADILLVDDDPAIIQLMSRLLTPVGHHRFATDGERALNLAREAPPDLMMLDAEMPRMNGFQVCSAMRSDPVLRHVPVIFVTSHASPEVQINCLNLGANDYVSKPFEGPVLLERVKLQLRVKREADRLRRAATLDLLTEVPNEHEFLRTLRREWRRSLREEAPMSLAMVELDHFDRYRAYHGGPAAERCLRTVATALQDCLARPGDLLACCGDHRFGVLLPSTAAAGTEHVAHRLLDGVESLGIAHAASPVANHVTASIGLSTFDPANGAAHGRTGGPGVANLDLLQAAEIALRHAVEAGGAQAWRLGVADAGMPALAHEIDPLTRAPLARMAH